MPKKIKIKYYISDGCAGKDRPHYINVDKEAWDLMSYGERDMYVHDMALAKIDIKWQVV